MKKSPWKSCLATILVQLQHNHQNKKAVFNAAQTLTLYILYYYSYSVTEQLHQLKITLNAVYVLSAIHFLTLVQNSAF